MEKKAFWITPYKSKKHHIAIDGISLCGSWMMTDESTPVSNTNFNEDDCKKCCKSYLNLIKQKQKV